MVVGHDTWVFEPVIKLPGIAQTTCLWVSPLRTKLPWNKFPAHDIASEPSLATSNPLYILADQILVGLGPHSAVGFEFFPSWQFSLRQFNSYSRSPLLRVLWRSPRSSVPEFMHGSVIRIWLRQLNSICCSSLGRVFSHHGHFWPRRLWNLQYQRLVSCTPTIDKWLIR